MSTPLVSVITTIYNCENFIEESLESVFNQTFKDFEFIIYDDASTDRTMQVVADFLRNNNKKFDGLVTVIHGEKNVGCGEGRNRAIDTSISRYVAIHDGDDISYSNRIEKEVKILESNPDLFCVGSWADVINAKSEKIESFDYPPKHHNQIVEDIYKMINPIIDPSTLFRREVFNELGCYDTYYNLVPDYCLWTKALYHGCVFTNIQEKLISYRKHDNSNMGKFWREALKQHKSIYNYMVAKYKKEVFFRDS